MSGILHGSDVCRVCLAPEPVVKLTTLMEYSAHKIEIFRIVTGVDVIAQN